MLLLSVIAGFARGVAAQLIAPVLGALNLAPTPPGLIVCKQRERKSAHANGMKPETREKRE